MEELFLIKNCKRPLKYKYFLTKSGKVWSGFSKRFLAPFLDKDGYLKVRLISSDNKRHSYSIHRLMLENFSPLQNAEKLQMDLSY